MTTSTPVLRQVSNGVKTFQFVVLLVSGLALLYASSMRLISPENAVFLKTYFDGAASGLSFDVDLINETRGVGAVMLLGGVVALIGAFRRKARFTSFVVVSVLLGGVVLGRSVSFIVDGIPNPDLIRIAFVESLLTTLNLVGLSQIMNQARKPD